MTTETPMDGTASLSGSAAKLLLHLLLHGDGPRAKSETLRLSGISDWRLVEKAREDLEALGLLPIERVLGTITSRLGTTPTAYGNHSQLLGTIPSPVGAIPNPLGIIPTTDRLTDADFARALTSVPWPVPSASASYIAPGSLEMADALAGVPAEERNFSEVLPEIARKRCQDADVLPWSGDPMRPTSEFQVRRDAQVKAVCLAFGELFPAQNPLTTARAKELLRTADNVAEDVYDALEASAGKDYPFGYAKRILENKPKRPEDHSDEYLEWTPELQERQRRGEERMRAMNLPAYFFGDDDDD